LQLDRAEHDGGEGLPRGSVLLIDEAGMVDSATLSRLVSHAERALAKLVLVGDPEQLGEIEAGGLFRALAERGEPIYLDEVIRHRHDLDRIAAKRIREGEGREALSLYESGERVTVAPDAEARREAMVRDWHEAFERGEDAVMVAKRNADVRKLNELAREVRRQDGQLGAQEIEVEEAGFAAGDLVITRVNDPRAEIFNRERWRIAEVDAERRVVLDGIDQAKRVEIGDDYLARTNPNSEAPALEHAYAVTTYLAQGTTVDRAFVMADPSMDKQELYVAASRSREETFIYATPEIQVHREEIAPESAYLREGIPHIGEAAERDRSQLAAHDAALRSRFSGLPTEELVARRDELRAVAGHEESRESQRRSLQERIEQARERLDRFESEREAAQALPRRQRRDELARIDAWEARSRDAVVRLEAEARELPDPGQAARRELAVADQVLAQRRELALVAARISPPAYVKAELGERPGDPTKRKAWDRGVAGIERYRQEHGIKDPNKAFGREAKRGAERARQEAAQRRLQEVQRALGLGQHAARARQLGKGLSIGR
jgi:AAA domain-containing protein